MSTPISLTITVTHQSDDSTPLPDDPQNKNTIWDLDDAECNPTEEAREEMRQRIKAWEAGEWCYIGVIVEVTVRIRYQTLGGRYRFAVDNIVESLWGVESDSGDDYLISTARELTDEALVELDLSTNPAQAIERPVGRWVMSAPALPTATESS